MDDKSDKQNHKENYEVAIIEKVDKRKTMPHLWKKGVSANPEGRPKKEAYIPDIMEEISKMELSGDLRAKVHSTYRQKIKTIGQLWCFVILRDGIIGSTRIKTEARKLVADMLFRKKLEITGDPSQPLSFRWEIGLPKEDEEKGPIE